MIDARSDEITIVDGLKAYLSTKKKPCEVVMANQTGDIPRYPYVTYTITTPAEHRSGTYSIAEDGTYYRTLRQIWSFTVNSDDSDESLNLALKAYDWFVLAGLTYLNDRDIIVRKVGNVNNRDNLITVEYEHRNGFDVHFGLLHTITMTEQEIGGYIEKINLKEE